MKLLVISHSCVTDVNQQLYVALSRLPDVQIEMVVPSSWKSEYSGLPQKPTSLPGIDFPIHYLPITMPGQISLHFYLSGLNQILRDFQPDIVFVDEEPWSLVLAQITMLCRRRKTSLVCYTKQNILKRYPFPFSWIEQRTYRDCAAIIALSEEVQAVLRAKGFQGSCPLLAHACDLSLFSPRQSDEMRSSLGLHGVVIGYMGRFVKEKGLDTLVQAIAALQKPSGAEVMCLMVGSGPEEESLRKSIAAANLDSRFVFTGAVPHNKAGDYMRCMDIFALPSLTMPNWKEQFGRVIIEAMACGVPVVGSNSGQIPYVIQDTEGGLIFEEGNAADLTAKLSCLITDTDLRLQLGKTGAESVRCRYAYEAIAQELHRILLQSFLPERI